MKKRIMTAAVTFFVSLTACVKETVLPENATESISSVAPSGMEAQTFLTCNRLINVFNPGPNVIFSLGMQLGTSYRKFSVPTYGVLDFTKVDKIMFEFSGLYADRANTVKLYRIRRTDGKYLTFQIAAAYVSKMEGIDAQYQLWVLNSLGSNKYNLMLPKMNTCYLLRTYYNTDLQANRLGFLPSYQTSYEGSIVIYVLPETYTKPLTQ
jgi:hypothetical protein